jgi:hypothetical protein
MKISCFCFCNTSEYVAVDEEKAMLIEKRKDRCQGITAMACFILSQLLFWAGAAMVIATEGIHNNNDMKTEMIVGGIVTMAFSLLALCCCFGIKCKQTLKELSS